MSRRLLAFAALALSFAGQPARGEDAFASFVTLSEGARACWVKAYDSAHLARHPQQSVARIALSMQYRRETPDSDGDAPRNLLFYALDVDFRDGRKGQALGNCLPGEGGSISCAVECDGGGVDVKRADGGAVSVDLARSKQIRLQYCGADGERIMLRAEPGQDRFILPAMPEKTCPDVVMPDWNEGID